MENLLNLWNWFDGKKTTIAFVLLALANILTKVVSIWSLEAAWIMPTIETLEYLSGIIGTLGLSHKVYKTSNEQK
jgi:hypothetical protein